MVVRQLTKEERILIVEVYMRTYSYVAGVDGFRRRFPDRRHPTTTKIGYNVRKYRQHGTILNRNENNSGRRRTG